MSLQDKLKEVEKLRRETIQSRGVLDAIVESHDKVIADLKQQIADSEITYSIGDRFTFGGCKRLLVSIGAGKATLVSLAGGKWQVEHIRPKDLLRITQAEFADMCGTLKYVRYWDNLKQCKCQGHP